ncbi:MULTISPECIES: glycosyltransferase family 87 protein [unclassified Luteococcus]|uniref:glycosyltransferase family 87 protein n=1 Tax=unclassified Luteococcus TaxID=2639923 RepID=UPI00313AACC2
MTTTGGGRFRTGLAAVGVFLAAFLTGRYALVAWQLRAPEDARYPYPNPGMTDLRDTVTLPARALARGIDPYRVDAYTTAFPHAQEFDPYMPWWLTVTKPLADLPWDRATLVWSWVLAGCVSACVVGVSARIRQLGAGTWSPVLLAAGMICAQWLWRPTTFGQGLGNVGALASLVTLLAILPADRDRWLAPWVALAWVKPQFGIPVVVVLLCRGQWRRVLGGTMMAVVASLPMIGRLVQLEGGLPALLRTVLASASQLSTRTDLEPLQGRVDTVAQLTLWGAPPSGAVGLLAGAAVLALTARLAMTVSERSPAPATLLVGLALLVTFPHIHYDLALLAPLVVWVVVDRRGGRWALAIALFLAVVGLLPGHALVGGEYNRVQAMAVQLAFLGALGWALTEFRTIRRIPRGTRLDQ